MDLEAGLKIELTVTELESKVFPDNAPEGTKTPYLTYSHDSSDHQCELQGYNSSRSDNYVIEVFHERKSTVISLKKSIVSKLKAMWEKNIALSGPYIQQLEILNDFETYEDAVKLYKGVVEINIYYEEV